MVAHALGRVMPDDHEFKANLGYMVKPCLKIKKKKNPGMLTCESEWTSLTKVLLTTLKLVSLFTILYESSL
jgi:hypothetical protein